MLLAIWKSVLAENFKTSLIRRKPLLVPSVVFTITILIVMIYAPLPMSVYKGPNQRSDYQTMSVEFQMYEPGVYENYVELRVSQYLESDERIEVFANFSQGDIVIESLAVNMTPEVLDSNHGLVRNINLALGLYNVSVITVYYIDGILQDPAYPHILLNQPIDSAFMPEITDWSTYPVILGFCCFFLFLGGLCIGREEKTRRRREPIDEEPPRDELYRRRF